MMANSITAKLLTLAVVGKGQAEAGSLKFIFQPGRLALLTVNLLCFNERNSEGISAGPAISHSGCRDKKNFSTILESLVLGGRYHLYFSYRGVMNIGQCARIFWRAESQI